MSAMNLSLTEAAFLAGGRFLGQDGRIARVSTDSRDIAAGDLFVALKGERFDGGAFAEEALERGAVAVMLEAGQAPHITQAIRVDDTRAALGRLATGWRQRFDLPVVALTGSNGKTTVKEMLAAILAAEAGSREAVLATAGNLNNDIGVPLTLLRLRAHHRYAVIEMGMNHAGEIAYLTRLARPDVALVNNAMTAHIGNLGSVEAIARAKGEIFEGLTAAGIAVFNADDAHAGLWRGLNAERVVVDFGRAAGARVRGEITAHPLGSRLVVFLPHACLDIALAVPGEHNAMNALAAIATAFALDVGNRSLIAGVSAYTGTPGRLQYKPGRAGALFIDDTYNANPDSAKAAIAVLAARPGKTILVLGDMGELGDGAPDMHAEVGAAARAAGIQILLTLGTHAREAALAFGAGATHFDTPEALLAALEPQLDETTTVLVKGSRFMRMERVVAPFTEMR